MISLIDQSLDREEIKKILPHRERWLLLDKVLNLDTETATATAIKTFTEEECRGHFPSHLVVPGYLVAEALAQTGGIIIGLQIAENNNNDKTAENNNNNKKAFLAGSRIRFRLPVFPSQEVVLKATLTKKKGGIFFFNGRASVDGKLVVDGDFIIALKN